MAEKINDVQALELDLISKASFNAFDGEGIVKILIKNKHLWKAVIMDRTGFSSKANESVIDLIKLRDLPANEWNVDTLFILAEENKEKELATLVGTWGADEISWIEGEEADRLLGESPSNAKILSLWWD